MLENYNTQNMNKGAIFSDDVVKTYRYQLWRIWDDNKDKVAIVGLNPSIADENIDDPTITRCINFVKNWGYGGFYMVNLFAFRSTDPRNLSQEQDPIGPDNDKHLKSIFNSVDKVICAWGNGGTLNNRSQQVLKLIREPYCLKKNSIGEPAHPLRLQKDIKPTLLHLATDEQKKLSKTQNTVQHNSIDLARDLIDEINLFLDDPYLGSTLKKTEFDKTRQRCLKFFNKIYNIDSQFYSQFSSLTYSPPENKSGNDYYQNSFYFADVKRLKQILEDVIFDLKLNSIK